MRIPVTIYTEAVMGEGQYQYSNLLKHYNQVEMTNIGGTLYFKYTQNT